MSDVKIKLTADGSQVRKELKLIDKELQELGGSTTPKGKTKSNTGSKPESSQGEKGKSTGENAKIERRDKVLTQLQREATLIRKELQKINRSNGQGGQSSNDSTTQPSSGSGSNSTPPAGGGSGSGDGNNNNGKLAGVLGKLATATLALKAVSSAWNYVSSGAQSSATGESLAYKTYGSTLAYTDYYDAKKDAKNLGSPYGYDYDTVMNAGNTFMSRGGFTNLNNYNEDMDSILATSKAWGLDASALANTSGYMSAIGAVDSGNQKKFADLLAESIIQAEMTGREDEQLQVLETISENLARVNTTVSEQSLVGSLGMYNALVAQNENLKGTRGSDIVTSMQDMATSGNRSLDILAGFGTEYTGLSGQLALRKLAEENPEEYWARVYEGVQTYGLGDDYFKKLLYDNTGSISQAEDIMSSLPEMALGTYDLSDTSQGANATQDRLDNYGNADVSTQETYAIEKDDTKESVGEGWNNLTEPFRDWYSGLSTGGRIATDATLGAGKLALGYGGVKLGGKALTGLLGKLGLGTAAGAGGAGAAGAGGAAAAGGSGLLGTLGTAAPWLAGAAAVSYLGYHWWNDETGGENGGGREWAINNYDDWRAGLPLIGGLWRKDGTIWQQQQNMSSEEFAERHPDLESGIIDSETGRNLTYGELAEIERQNDAIAQQWSIDNADNIDAFKAELARHIGEDGSVDLSFMNGTDLSTANMLLNSVFGEGTLQGMTYMTAPGTTMSDMEWGAGESNWYGMQLQNSGLLDDIKPLAESATSLTDSVDSLTTEVSEMRAWLESNGYQGTAVWTDQAVRDTYTSAQGLPINPFSNSSVLGRQYGLFGLYGTSHATGNDYVPYDNYLASLHKGEMVLTASEADDYRRGNVGTSVGGGTSHAGSLDININLNGSVEGLTSENQNKIVEAVVSQLSSVGLQNLISTGFQRIQNY